MKAPAHLDDQAQAKWAEVHAILEARGEPLDAGTLDALTSYASSWSQWLSASEQVKAIGLICKSPNGFPVENLYVGVARKAQVAVRQWAAELLLTPRGRKGTARAKPAASPEPPPIEPDVDEQFRTLSMLAELGQAAEAPGPRPGRRGRRRKA
jgi:P27 family predicted phage terminase small subunit